MLGRMTRSRSRMRRDLGLALGCAAVFGGLAVAAGGFAAVALGAPSPTVVPVPAKLPPTQPVAPAQPPSPPPPPAPAGAKPPPAQPARPSPLPAQLPRPSLALAPAKSPLARPSLPSPAPSPAPSPSPFSAQPLIWADWVGDYTGKLAWRGCAVPGSASGTVAIDAVDAVVSIDSAALGGGLRAMSLVESDDDGGWSGQQGDVQLRVTRAKPAAALAATATATAATATTTATAATTAAIDLAIELDSGCTVRGQLARPTTSVAACDRLVGWSRIEARCSKLAQQNRKPLEDAALIAKTRWRPADAERCAARAEKLELSLIDAGCAPHPDRAIGTRAPECQRLVDTAARVARCKTLPPALESELTRKAQALAAAAQTAEPATLPYVEEQCRDGQRLVASIATRFQCPL